MSARCIYYISRAKNSDYRRALSAQLTNQENSSKVVDFRVSGRGEFGFGTTDWQTQSGGILIVWLIQLK